MGCSAADSEDTSLHLSEEELPFLGGGRYDPSYIVQGLHWVQ